MLQVKCVCKCTCLCGDGCLHVKPLGERTAANFTPPNKGRLSKHFKLKQKVSGSGLRALWEEQTLPTCRGGQATRLHRAPAGNRLISLVLKGTSGLNLVCWFIVVCCFISIVVFLVVFLSWHLCSSHQVRDSYGVHVCTYS